LIIWLNEKFGGGFEINTFHMREYATFHPIVNEVIDSINNIDKNIQIDALHIWRVGKGKYSCILSISINGNNINIDEIKKHLVKDQKLVHITIEQSI
jgi:Co/Zn/Cd efflux system component